jgi:hypothetical protein
MSVRNKYLLSHKAKKLFLTLVVLNPYQRKCKRKQLIFAVIPTTIINVTLYFPVRKVLLTLITGLQCAKLVTHCGKHKKTRFNTG